MPYKRTHENCARWTTSAGDHVECDYGALLPRLLPKGGCARDCSGWSSRDGKIHVCMKKIRQVYFGNRAVGIPMEILAHCDDGHVYKTDTAHVMQARCAKWRPSIYTYEECGETYTDVSFTGADLPFVTTESQRLR